MGDSLKFAISANMLIGCS